MRTVVLAAVASVTVVPWAGAGETAFAAATEPNLRPIEITILYDNYKRQEDCRTDWGFSCLIAGFEKTILFDTGTRGDILLENIDKLHINVEDVNMVVISHDHGDHTGGLTAFLDRRGGVDVYLPKSASKRLVQAAGTRGANPVIVNGPRQLCDHAHLTGPLGVAIIEQAVVLDTTKGLVVITGCAHPGVVEIVRKAKDMLGKDVYLVLGGFHLLDKSDAQVQAVIGQLRDLGVKKAGASHCTGDKAIALFKQAYGVDFVPLGVGKLDLPLEWTAKP